MALSQSLIDRMRARAQAVKESGGGGSRFPRFDLGGKKAIAQPGAHAIVRVLPRWDIADKFIQQNGKYVANPDYVEGFIYHEAAEHWYTRQRDGQRLPTWCLKSFGTDNPCPLCEAAEAFAQSGDDADLETAKDMAAKPLFLYNVVVGTRGKRVSDENGLVKIGVLPLWGALYVQMIDIMTGSGEEGFSCDDVSDPKTGFDLMLTRPAKDSGDRWKITPAKTATTLYTKDDEAQFANWHTRLIDIPAALESERKTYPELYKDVYGEEPSGAEFSAGGTDAASPASFDPFTNGSGEPAAAAIDDEIAAEAEAGDDADAEDPPVAGDPFGFDQPPGAAAPVAVPAAATPRRAAATGPGPRKPPPPAEKPARGGRQPARGRR